MTPVTTPTTRSIVPSRLHRIKTFESVSYYTHADGGRRNLQTMSTPSIEQQSDEWVNTTKNLIVGSGPLYLMRVEQRVAEHPQPLVMETRTLAVIYVPAVEQQNVSVHGEDTRAAAAAAITAAAAPGQVPGLRGGVEPLGGGAAAGPGQPDDGGRGPLRLPPIP